MKAFRVFQDNKRCNDYAIKGWTKDTFATLEEAQAFAVHWCYPCYIKDYKEWPHPTKLNEPIDMSTHEFPIMMEIRQIEE